MTVLVDEGRESRLIYLTVFLMYCDCQCSVPFPRGALGWSAVYDLGILTYIILCIRQVLFLLFDLQTLLL